MIADNRYQKRISIEQEQQRLNEKTIKESIGTSESFLTDRQRQAREVLNSIALHVLLYGGSRSGKTFEIIDFIVERALSAPYSRHALFRLHFKHIKSSIVSDTFPKVMRTCYPDIEYHLDRSDFFVTLPNESEIWFAGLDDGQRTEKVLGMEYATILLNECSQISFDSRETVMTRLAQKVMKLDGTPLPMKMLYDENPPSKRHWTYKLFFKLTNPESRKKLESNKYAQLQMNPEDNKENLSSEYLGTLDDLSTRKKKRFRSGEFQDTSDNDLFTEEMFDRWRLLDIDLPDFQRVIVAVDPSGADDENNENNDAIGIFVAALGVDGIGYALEDLTVKGSPKVWGKVATSAYDRHSADRVVAEVNYGGAMVKFVIQTARPETPFKMLHASRGKVVRAEPISALLETGKIRIIGEFPDLEDELLNFTTTGYIGENSPNRADAFVWAFTELFPGMVEGEKKVKKKKGRRENIGSQGWMG